MQSSGTGSGNDPVSVPSSELAPLVVGGSASSADPDALSLSSAESSSVALLGPEPSSPAVDSLVLASPVPPSSAASLAQPAASPSVHTSTLDACSFERITMTCMIRHGVVGDDVEPEGESPKTSGLRRGATVGRYVVLEPIGAGSMGVVYRAYDPELDRRVALKLVVVRGGFERRAAEVKARLMREAQALARV